MNSAGGAEQRAIVVPRLRQRFITALVVLAALAGLSSGYVQWIFVQQGQERDAVTLLEQHQLSAQELVSASLQARNDRNNGSAAVQEARESLDAAIGEFGISYVRLAEAPALNVDVLRHLDPIHVRIGAFALDFRRALNADEEITDAAVAQWSEAQGTAMLSYGGVLDVAADELLASSNGRVASMQRLGVIFLILTMMALFWMGRLVFLPAVNRVDTAWEKLEQRESQLVLAQSTAVEASRAKSEFLANMSHELRTPMNGVIGMASLMAETELNKEQAEYLSAIRTSGDSLLSVINDILDFSKIEARKLDIESYPFELRDQLEDALDVISPMVTAKGLSLVFDVDPSLPDRFVSDPARIRQILNNFLSNAVKFTEVGEIVLRVGGEQLSSDRHADVQGDWRLHFEVADTGIGVPKDRLQRLFQSFSQVDASHARRFGGTGLGLAISKQLAELMGGTAWAESEEGVGSTFHFTVVTRCESTDGDVDFFSARQERLEGVSVLVVEHNSTALNHIERQLAMWGVDVTAVADRTTALQAVERSGTRDVAVIDSHLPSGDGVALARDLAVRCPTTDLILMTPLGGRLARPADVEIEAYISKPIKPSSLFDALIEVVAGDRLPDVVAADDGDGAGEPVRDLRILLAEDNQVNQKVALGLLGKFGHTADVAGNGLEALAMLRQRPYDVVLMDVHMPEMDGCEATVRIREDFDASDQPHIIAMTANALSGDRERFLDIGMNDYVSKPVQPRRLAEALERVPRATVDDAAAMPTPARAPAPTDPEPVEVEAAPEAAPPAVQIREPDDMDAVVSSSAPDPDVDEPAINEPASMGSTAGPAVEPGVLAEFAELIGDDDGGVRRDLIDTFLADGSERLSRLGAARAEGDIDTVKIEAHTLKSSSAQVGALALSAACAEIEAAARAGSLDGVSGQMDGLSFQFVQVSAGLLGIRRSLPVADAA